MKNTPKRLAIYRSTRLSHENAIEKNEAEPGFTYADPVGSFNNLVVELDANGFIHTLPVKFLGKKTPTGKVKKPIIIGQTPLSLRQSITILEQNIGDQERIADYAVEHAQNLGIDLPEIEIRKTASRLFSFTNPSVFQNNPRMEDLEFFYKVYHGLANSDESRLGIGFKEDKSEPFVPKGQDLPLDETVIRRLAIQGILGTLSVREEIVLVSTAVEEMAIKDITEKYGFSKGSVSTAYARATGKLRFPTRARHLLPFR